MSPAVQDILDERQRQVAAGYDAAHDDTHPDGAIIKAAIAHLLATRDLVCEADDVYPWPNKPEWIVGQHREDLVTAAALIVAEIERWDRLRSRAGAERDGITAP